MIFSTSGRRPALRSALSCLGLALIACAPLQPAEAETRSYRCEAGRSLHVTQGKGGATVIVSGRRYDLKAKASSLGARYVSPNASLIIDGTFAAFVADDLLDLADCRAD